MSRERKQSAEIQHTIESPSDAMNSYIGDLLCTDAALEIGVATVLEKHAESSDQHASGENSSTNSQLPLSNSIKPGFMLIPLVSLDRYQLDLSRPQRSLSQSFMLLLWGLYLLRMPISGRLRSSVFEHCHQRLMEYRLLTDITRLPSAGGGRNE